MPQDLCVQLVPLFQDLSGEDQLNIQRSTKFRAFHKGDIVFSPHSDPQLSIVARGSMKVYRITSNGREQLISVIEPACYEGHRQQNGEGGKTDAVSHDGASRGTSCVVSARPVEKRRWLTACPNTDDDEGTCVISGYHAGNTVA